MKIAVVGANGQLGQDVADTLERRGHKLARLTHADMEIRDLEAARKALAAIKPDCVVNTAAMLQVDAAEDEPDKAFAVNALGVRNLALLAGEQDFALCEFGTDYVFDGEKGSPYVESDPTLPLGVYASSKLAGENFVRTLAPKHFVVRVSGIYGLAPCRGKQGDNFVRTMLRLARERGEVKVVSDEFLTPTFTADIAEQIAELLPTNAYGLYHMTAGGECSWHEFTAKIFELAGVKAKLGTTTRDRFPTKAKRPRYSVLDNAALRSIGIEKMPHWSDGLGRYIAQIAT